MKSIFTQNGALFLLGYLLIFMTLGTIAISKLNSLKEFTNLQIRKMFHVLAFFLFLPGVFINVRNIIWDYLAPIHGICVQLFLSGHALCWIGQIFPKRSCSLDQSHIWSILQKLLWQERIKQGRFYHYTHTTVNGKCNATYNILYDGPWWVHWGQLEVPIIFWVSIFGYRWYCGMQLIC